MFSPRGQSGLGLETKIFVSASASKPRPGLGFVLSKCVPK